MSNTWHKTRWFHVGCREIEQSAAVAAASLTTSARWLTAVRDVRARGAWRAISSYLCTRSKRSDWCFGWVLPPRPALAFSCTFSSTKGSPVIRVPHAGLTPGSSAVFPTLKAAVAQPTTVPLNPVMPIPEPHCYKWGPGVSRQWRVRDLPGVPLCLYPFFLLEDLGLVLRLGFQYGGFFLWSENSVLVEILVPSFFISYNYRAPYLCGCLSLSGCFPLYQLPKPRTSGCSSLTARTGSWHCTSLLTPTLKRLRQEDCWGFEGSLTYRVSSSSLRYRMRPCLRQTNRTQIKTGSNSRVS